ncbi:MAG: hypothetical protein BHW64_06975 [Candidatus Melainabacteria bacterium LEY3_CP_29_8]|nr:MAG: hypothetical protein BHW64_06975 [Candidatus Melainabacteria bacterium LEY3_CP_29_8]
MARDYVHVLALRDEEIKENKIIVKGGVLDNSNISEMEQSWNNILKLIGNDRIDILVNNAGVISKTHFGNTDEADYDSVMNTNLKGTYFLSEMVSKYMIENGIKGNILNISSSSALRPAVSAYSMAKWAIHGLTLGMAKKLTPSEIGNLAVVMVSDMGKMVNGDTMYATGGCALLTLDDYD